MLREKQRGCCWFGIALKNFLWVVITRKYSGAVAAISFHSKHNTYTLYERFINSEEKQQKTHKRIEIATHTFRFSELSINFIRLIEI